MRLGGPPVNVSIFVEAVPGGFRATAVPFSDLTADGPTKQAVVDDVSAKLEIKLGRGEFVTWLPQSDPQGLLTAARERLASLTDWDGLEAEIAAYRAKLDAAELP
jgi:hypothetical protein